MRNNFILFLILFSIYLFSACQKDNEIYNKEDNERSNLIADSIYMYAQQIYYWNKKLPSMDVFNPRSFVVENADFESVREEVLAITKYAVNPLTNISYEFNQLEPLIPKYSTIINSTQNVTQTRNLFGLSFFCTEVGCWIEEIKRNSPADKAGLQRGMKLLSLNAKKVFGLSAEKEIADALQKDRIDLSFELEESEKKVHLNAFAFAYDPVNIDTIFNYKGAKIGYLSLSEFISPDGLNYSLDRSFNAFRLGAVESLVVDLRYNEGGYISTCDYLMNLIIPTRLNGAVMRTEVYNETLQQRKADILRNQLLLDQYGKPAIYIDGRPATLFDVDFSEEANTYHFEKVSGIEHIKKLVFIVSTETASASELLINSLRPYVDVKIVGVGSSNSTEKIRTYGKPIGFFDLTIGEYKLYLSLFKNINAEGYGDYYDGIASDVNTIDDVTVELGNLEEFGLYEALQICVNNISNAEIGLGKRMLKKDATPFNNQRYKRIRGERRTPVLIRDNLFKIDKSL